MKATLLEQLHELDEDGLREIRSQASFLLAERVPDTDSESGFYAVMCDVLTEHGCYSPIPYGTFKRLPQYKAFREAVPVVTSYVRQYLKPANRLEERKAYNVLLAMVCRWLKTVEIPRTVKTCVENLEKIPSLVEVRFPGYREAGMLPAILRAKKRV